jgi:hypothetical protein
MRSCTASTAPVLGLILPMLGRVRLRRGVLQVEPQPGFCWSWAWTGMHTALVECRFCRLHGRTELVDSLASGLLPTILVPAEEGEDSYLPRISIFLRGFRRIATV